MITQERHGQLVLGRILWPFPAEEVPKMLDQQKQIQSQHSTPSVVCIDARGANVVPQDVAEGLIKALSTKRVRRLAIISAQRFIAEMQLERILKTAEQEKGRVFQQPPEAEKWLAELLTAEEQRLLNEFLRAGPTKPASL